jgi:hypothetical protein
MCLLAAVGFAIYQMWYMSTGAYEVDYKNYWLLENGFWQILYTVVVSGSPPSPWAFFSRAESLSSSVL